MANLREIRERISSVKSTQQITKAMKMVAAAKLRKAQNKIIDTRPYANKLKSVMANLSSGTEVNSAYMKPTANAEHILYVIIGSDRGLCGGFNNNLFKVVEAHIQENHAADKQSGKLAILAVGRKPSEYFKKRGYKMVGAHIGIYDDLRFDNATAIMRGVMSDFTNGTYKHVFIAYNEFKSVLTQLRVVETLLPLDPSSLGGASDQAASSTDYIFEPSSEDILNKLIPLHLNTQLWKSLLESNASEQGARMTAMENATENAKELIRQLQLKYNQARQAAITTEISEIVSGAEALAE